MNEIIGKQTILGISVIILSIAGLYLSYYENLESRTIADTILAPIFIISLFALIENLKRTKDR